ncbi:XrtA/PEP-CTERM system histidine kinase PrsK [Sphingomicrobium sp. XHP0235]|uniref:XrtA/PEP-CTERM system histidine kinase PrsK n=1 Tax=Sphingomicrobium aquimarinum TaxID=3133971 RepID=UPI0031FEF502
MNAQIASWSHAGAAALFALLVVWQLVRAPRSSGQRTLIAAFALTSLWAWFELAYPGDLITDLAETCRNLVWIGLLHSLATSAEERDRMRGLTLVYGAVAAVLGMSLVAATVHSLTGYFEDNPASLAAIAQTQLLLRILAAAGGLVLVHNFYGQAAPGSRPTIRYAMIALAGLWFYDLNLYTVAYLSEPLGAALHDWRGVAVALVAPLFAIGARSEDGWRIKLSRAATFQSLSLLGICAYFTVMAILATVLKPASSDWVQTLAVLLLTVLTVAAMAILPNPRARAWAKVKVAKHFFEHRYDYRLEWLRFTDTVGGVGSERTPLGTRIVMAFAEMLDAPGGYLIVRDEHDMLRGEAQWNWTGAIIDSPDAITHDSQCDFWERVENDAHILEFDGLRGGWNRSGTGLQPPPAWLLAIKGAWVGVPLLHDRHLVGLVVLAAPEARRALDWEDFDLLRTAGRQAASALSENLSQDALAKAQRFEEFNRRFAFIMHDIKNLVSQLSLLSRNAERHADNPEFRADMVATLKGSVEKMNDLLARLAPQAQTRGQKAEPVPVGEILSFVLAARRGDHDLRLLGNTDRWAIGDAQALEQALAHLVQNAIDASPRSAPVTVRVEGNAHEVAIHVIDTGTGMDPDFLRTRLFEPFASTKTDGFGIGAFEARALIVGMGGRLAVDSQPGKGTRFTVTLAAAEPLSLRKTA